ncbi:accessory gene regulator B family protein [Clostridium gasigenes]|uniref:Accessory gene regulator B n=1 Tax=Clostridium gasigenes TaxID=94869 RepID=A0A1H0LEJ4_9CLOT|nr:accessory gene regulator B family protein [Clostridium gasigenes]MBB6714014.1 accessory gene regulator B family protein [Clostridium gasigenes]MBU3087286.1 accessory gene regulator B family protein [Clostridium gasigenes]SDO66421.1 accessory gene regulator B [Clostridium gasigenes]
MSRKLLKKIIKELALVSGYTKDQEEQVEYTIRVLFLEIIKIILLLFIFKIIGYFNEGLTLLICMVLTKPFIGGYHEKTQIKCFIATLLIASMIIILSIKSKLDFFSIIVLDMISIFIVYNRAPILNDDMPITKLELINKNRRIGITMTILASVISLIVFEIAEYSEIIVWTIFINASLMFNKK